MCEDPTVVDSDTCVPPDAAVNHPTRLYPSLVAVGNGPYGLPNVSCLEVSVKLPPFPLKVTVYVGYEDLSSAVLLTLRVPIEVPLSSVALMSTLFVPVALCVTVFVAVPITLVVPTAQSAGKSKVLVPDVVVPSMLMDQGFSS